jgi:hypothetical protein
VLKVHESPGARRSDGLHSSHHEPCGRHTRGFPLTGRHGFTACGMRALVRCAGRHPRLAVTIWSKRPTCGGPCPLSVRLSTHGCRMCRRKHVKCSDQSGGPKARKDGRGRGDSKWGQARSDCRMQQWSKKRRALGLPARRARGAGHTCLWRGPGRGGSRPGRHNCATCRWRRIEA